MNKLPAPPNLKPNCKVITDERNPVWETRWYNLETGYVYAAHDGYLWPQRKPEQYHKFQLLQGAVQDVPEVPECSDCVELIKASCSPSDLLHLGFTQEEINESINFLLKEQADA